MDKELSRKFFQRVLTGNALREADTEKFIVQTESLDTLLTMYQCAVTKLRARIDVVTAEFEITENRNPLEYVESRIKKPLHIMEKLQRKGFEFSIESIVYNLNDVAGIRLVCSFIDDIYRIADMLLTDDTYTLVEKVDYIKNPKPNGYRSLHLIIEVPVIFSQNVQKMKVEVQIRTIAMDFWASLEHQIHYKRDFEKKDEDIVRELKECADVIYSTDVRMQEIQKRLLSLSEPKG